ncbi:hypothetical protein [Flindersiella endophytica]
MAEDSDERSYGQLINIAAGTVTIAASVLGIFGVSAGIATALLRNAPAPSLTVSGLGGVGVMVGLGSAFVGNQRLGESRWTKLALALGALCVADALVMVGWFFTGRGANSLGEMVAWWLFLTFLAGVTAGIAAVAWRKPGWRAGPVLSMAGVYLFGMAVLCVVILIAATLRTTGRPTIELTAKPSGESVTLTGKVAATGLSNDDRYEIRVELLDQDVRVPDPPAEVYRTFAGPNAAGDLDYSFTITVPAKAELPWAGVTAQLGDERAGVQPVAAGNCGLREAGKPAPPAGATCATVRIVP